MRPINTTASRFLALSLFAVFSATLLFFLTPTPSAALGIWDGRYPVSCNVPSTGDDPSNPQNQTVPCTLCDGLKITVNAVDLLTQAALAIAGAMVAYGGFRLMTSGGSDSIYKEGKQIIVGALIGLGITLFSWVIVNTLLSLLSNGSISLTNPITCTPPPASFVPAVGSSALRPATNQPATGSGYRYSPASIGTQVADASQALSSLLSCMQSKLPDAAKRITSISDSQTIRKCIDTYSRPPCAHAQYSCHYGGTKCRGQYKSFGVDFGEEQYSGDIGSAARACNPRAFVYVEGDHVHVSVGMSEGCGCN